MTSNRAYTRPDWFYVARRTLGILLAAGVLTGTGAAIGLGVHDPLEGVVIGWIAIGGLAAVMLVIGATAWCLDQ